MRVVVGIPSLGLSPIKRLTRGVWGQQLM